MGELSRSLKVRVIKGSKLQIKDKTMTSDPYVVIKLAKQTRKTGVKKRSLNPVWDQELIFTVANISHHDHDHSSLTVEVWDHDTLSRDDFMGAAEIDLKPLLHELYPIANGRKLVSKSSKNDLEKDSFIVEHKDGVRNQDLCLKLGEDDCGSLELKLEW